MIEPRQIRAARALLNWSQDDLARASSIARSSIKNIENEITIARRETLEQIGNAFATAGVEFTPNSGVKLKQDSILVFSGPQALQKFFEDVYQTLQAQKGGEILVYGVDEKQYEDIDQTMVDEHLARLKLLGGVTQKVLCRKGDTNFTVPYAAYRWVEPEMFASVPFYVYGDRLAMVLWQPVLQTIILQYPQLVDAYRKQFMNQWKTAEVPTK